MYFPPIFSSRSNNNKELGRGEDDGDGIIERKAALGTDEKKKGGMCVCTRTCVCVYMPLCIRKLVDKKKETENFIKRCPAKVLQRMLNMSDIQLIFSLIFEGTKALTAIAFAFLPFQ